MPTTRSSFTFQLILLIRCFGNSSNRHISTKLFRWKWHSLLHHKCDINIFSHQKEKNMAKLRVRVHYCRFRLRSCASIVVCYFIVLFVQRQFNAKKMLFPLRGYFVIFVDVRCACARICVCVCVVVVCEGRKRYKKNRRTWASFVFMCKSSVFSFRENQNKRQKKI